MVRVAIVLGSVRPGRKVEPIGRWVLEIARQRGDADFELVDLTDFSLPLLDESALPSAGQYANAHTRAWAAAIDSFDGCVFVTPEYSHGVPAALKNAIDYLYREWNNKAAGFVSYGGSGGVRAVEQLRLVMGELQVADVRAQVALSMFTDFVEFTEFKPAPHREKSLTTMLNQVVAWSSALKTLRAQQDG
jgi:NAD(P)H-dependent FMN reductase